MSEQLTPRQERFVAEYLISGNATQSAIKAGYAEGSAHVTANVILKNAKVAKHLEGKRQKVFQKLEFTHERVINEIARVAFFDPRTLFNADGSPKPINELSDDTAACISGVEAVEMFSPDGTRTGSIKRYKVADKNAALEKAAKILGLFEKDNAQGGGALADAIKGFLGQLHGSGGSRLPIAPPQA